MRTRSASRFSSRIGMDDEQVKRTINAQVLWVFFLPLAATALHMLFASKIMAQMLRSFMLYDWGLVLTCIGGTLLAFTLPLLWHLSGDRANLLSHRAR